MPYKMTSTDATLAGSLISSPVWASWLNGFNELLSTLTLLIGLVLGVYRLWRALHDQKARRANDKLDRLLR